MLTFTHDVGLHDARAHHGPGLLLSVRLVAAAVRLGLAACLVACLCMSEQTRGRGDEQTWESRRGAAAAADMEADIGTNTPSHNGRAHMGDLEAAIGTNTPSQSPHEPGAALKR